MGLRSLLSGHAFTRCIDGAAEDTASAGPPEVPDFHLSATLELGQPHQAPNISLYLGAHVGGFSVLGLRSLLSGHAFTRCIDGAAEDTASAGPPEVPDFHLSATLELGQPHQAPNISLYLGTHVGGFSVLGLRSLLSGHAFTRCIDGAAEDTASAGPPEVPDFHLSATLELGHPHQAPNISLYLGNHVGGFSVLGLRSLLSGHAFTRCIDGAAEDKASAGPPEVPDFHLSATLELGQPHQAPNISLYLRTHVGGFSVLGLRSLLSGHAFTRCKRISRQSGDIWHLRVIP